MITSKQRAQLRSMANTLDTIFQIGKGGLSEMLAKNVDEALEVREIVKIRLLETAEIAPKEAAVQLAGELDADIVQVIGRRFTLYRESKNNKQIELVRK